MPKRGFIMHKKPRKKLRLDYKSPHCKTKPQRPTLSLEFLFREIKPIHIHWNYRLQTDWKDVRVLRERKYRKYELTFEQKYLRQYYLQARERDHETEAFKRTARSYWDWLSYNRLLPVCEKPAVLRMMKEYCRTNPTLCLGRLNCTGEGELYRVTVNRNKTYHRDFPITQETIVVSRQECEELWFSYFPSPLLKAKYIRKIRLPEKVQPKAIAKAA
jgi:hypothetical protein